MEELKPCPFCGGKARMMQIELNHESIMNGKWWIIGCDGTNALCLGYMYKCVPFYTSRQLAVKMWNNRDEEEQVKLE